MKRSDIKALLSKSDYEIYCLLKRGKSQSDIARSRGVSRQSIFFKVQRLRRLGIKITRHPGKSPINSRPWTIQQESLMVDYYSEGLSIEEMASKLDRTPHAIRSRRSHLVAKGKMSRMRHRWTEDENEILTDSFNKRMSNREISKLVNRSISAVASQMSVLKARGLIKPDLKIMDSYDAFEKAIEMRLDGYTNVEISRKFGRAEVYVSQLFHKYRKMGYFVPLSPRFNGSIPHTQKYYM